MSDVVNIFLFDLDGVIVNPLAYRAGINKTLELLCQLNGLRAPGRLLPNESEISYLESCGVHDVWDITDIVFGIIMTRKATGGDEIEKPDYIAFAEILKQAPHTTHPPDVALEVLSSEISNSHLNKKEQSDCIESLNHLLLGTRSVYQSYGTRLFQNIILGSDEFRRTYELTSEYDGPSLLTTVDRVLISPSSVSKLNMVQESNQGHVAVYTARPSHPPENAHASNKGYSPEAELALEMAEMQDFPLVAMGMMEWLAEQKSVCPEHLTKPSNTQAFAALISALDRRTTVDALEQAYRLDKLSESPDNTSLHALRSKRVIIHVFEDTVSGIRPMLQITEKLNTCGYDVVVKALGITKDSTKKAALEHLCNTVFADVNEAIESIPLCR